LAWVYIVVKGADYPVTIPGKLATLPVVVFTGIRAFASGDIGSSHNIHEREN